MAELYNTKQKPEQTLVQLRIHIEALVARAITESTYISEADQVCIFVEVLQELLHSAMAPMPKTLQKAVETAAGTKYLRSTTGQLPRPSVNIVVTLVLVQPSNSGSVREARAPPTDSSAKMRST